MFDIPKDHPRYESLILREKISLAMRRGIVHETGLIAHGRGEAFDYLIGEKTLPVVDLAEKVTAAALLIAKNPVISVNGNVVALAARECIDLADRISGKIEINLFHRTDERITKIFDELVSHGASIVYGRKGDSLIPNLSHDRAICDKDGLFSADVVLVPLEDGDRCQALVDMNKKVITIDLNPLSRTSKTSDVTVVDNIIRAIPNIIMWIDKLKDYKKSDLVDLVNDWNNDKMLGDLMFYLSKRLNLMF